jgi:hypothetical protein
MGPTARGPTARPLPGPAMRLAEWAQAQQEQQAQQAQRALRLVQQPPWAKRAPRLLAQWRAQEQRQQAPSPQVLWLRAQTPVRRLVPPVPPGQGRVQA